MTDHSIEIVAARLLGPAESRTTDSMIYNGGALVIDFVNNRFIDSDSGKTGDAVDLVMKVRGIERDRAEQWIIGPPHWDTAPPALPEELFTERALIGLMLMQPTVIAALEEELLPEDFLFGLHGAIYEKLRGSADVNYDPGLPRLIEALGGDTGAVVAPGYTLGKYIAHLAATAPRPPSEPFAYAYGLARMIHKVADIERGAEPEPEPEGPKPPRFGMLRWSDIGLPGPRYQWIIKGIAPVGQVMLLAGPSRSGKSFGAIDMTMHVARGVDYLGRKTRQMGVAYCFYEAGDGAQQRLRAYQIDRDVPKDGVPFIALRQPPQLYGKAENITALAEAILAESKSWSVPLGVIAVDTHNAATRGSSEIASEDISQILDAYATLRRMTGAALWIVGHTNSGGKPRGNEQFFNSIDTALLYSRLSEHGIDLADDDGRVIRSVHIAKQREERDGTEWQFVLRRVEVGKDEDGEPVTSCVIDDPQVSGESKRDNSRRIKRTDGAFHLRNDAEIQIFKSILEVIKNNGIVPPATIDVPANITKIAKWSDVCEQYRRTEPMAQGDSETKYKERLRVRLSRAQQKLRQWAVISVDILKGDGGEYHVIWPTGKRVEGAGFSWPPKPPEAPGAPPADEGQMAF